MSNSSLNEDFQPLISQVYIEWVAAKPLKCTSCSTNGVKAYRAPEVGKTIGLVKVFGGQMGKRQKTSIVLGCMN